MIISASRRTDIPRYYFEWFLNRIEEGYLYVRNPYFKKQIRKIDLDSESITGIVFWTKYPDQMINKIDFFLNLNIPFYILYTITPYNSILEKNIPETNFSIKKFTYLSEIIGKQRIIWRYDPIILLDDFGAEKHYEMFNKMSEKLAGFTERCIVGFLTLYKKLEKRIKNLNIYSPSTDQKVEISLRLSETAEKYGLKLQTCAEDLANTDVSHLMGKCIDDVLIKRLTGKNISQRKDPGQRISCRCIKSIDIGIYNTCPGGCIYCYANMDQKLAEKNLKIHNPKWKLIDVETIL